ncbi:MAG: SPOR domain-containing protein [Phenylobacterium sp.]|uniref:cell division protein FtsN n=1 Tax=Phenylobacterium sp. TaxID=1871053 RepID=UPI00391C71BF
MSDPDRGAYTPPTDAPLAFDARQPVRGSRPAPVMLIVSAIVLLLLIVAIVMFYRSGVREAGQPPQTVGAPVGDLKAPAPAGAQPVDPAAGLQIYQSRDGEVPPAEPTFIPPPEQPQPRPAPVEAPPLRPTPTPPVTAAPAPPVVAQPAPPAPKTAPAPTPQAQPTTPAPPPAKAPAPAASGVAAVQIGAVSSEALADRAWNEAIRAAPTLGAGKGKRVEPVERDGTTLYRTLVTGFSSRGDAQAFCDQLKAAGKSCFVR